MKRSILLISTIMLLFAMMACCNDLQNTTDPLCTTDIGEVTQEKDIPAYLDPAELGPEVFAGVPGAIPFREVENGPENLTQISADIYLEGIYHKGFVFHISNIDDPYLDDSQVLQSGKKINNAAEAQQRSVALLQEQQRQYNMRGYAPACVTHIKNRNVWLLTYEANLFGWIFVLIDGKDGSFIAEYWC